MEVYVVGSARDDLKKTCGNLGYNLSIFRDKNWKLDDESEYKNIIYVDFTNKDSLVASLKEFDQKVDVIVSSLENYMLQTAWLGEILDKTALTEEAALKSTDKFLMREAFAAYAPEITPSFTKISNYEDIENFIKNYNFPLMLKPTNLVKSYLVTKNESIEELKTNYEYMVQNIDKFYKRAKVRNYEPQIIIEEFLDGTSHSVQCFMNDKGKVQTTNIVDLKMGRDVGFDDNFVYLRQLPSELDAKQQKKIKEIAIKSMKALNLKNCTGHVEIINTKSGPKIIEVNPRIGGYRYDMYLKAQGVDIYENYLNLLSGNSIEIENTKSGYIYVFELFPETIGKFDSVSGIELLDEVKDIEYEFEVISEVGDEVGPSGKGYRKNAVLKIWSENPHSIMKAKELVRKNIRVSTIQN